MILSTNLSFNTFLSCTRVRESFFLFYCCCFVATSVYSIRFAASCARKFAGFYYFLFALINLIDRNYHWGAHILFSLVSFFFLMIHHELRPTVFISISSFLDPFSFEKFTEVFFLVCRLLGYEGKTKGKWISGKIGFFFMHSFPFFLRRTFFYF